MRSAALPWVAALLLIGCRESADSPRVIEREVFIATWVDIRNIAARYDGSALPEAERTRLLQKRGVTEDQLLAFVDAYGEDPRYMLEVWTEVERRLMSTPDNDDVAPVGR